MALFRYAVWGDKGRGKSEIIEMSDDVIYLKNKYNVDEITRIGKKSE